MSEMSIGELIQSGLWAEKIITDEGVIFSSDRRFEAAKRDFLSGEKQTHAWRLIAYQIG